MPEIPDQKWLMMALDDRINEGDYEGVQKLLAQGADVNGQDRFGDTPLTSAIWVGADLLVQLLIERGADVNLPGKNGKTASQLVEEIISNGEGGKGHQEAARILKAAGA